MILHHYYPPDNIQLPAGSQASPHSLRRSTILYARSVVRWLWWFYEWLSIYTFYNVRVPRQRVTIINMHPVHPHPPTHLALKIKTNTDFSCRWVQQKVQSPIGLTKSHDLKCHACVNADVSDWSGAQITCLILPSPKKDRGASMATS